MRSPRSKQIARQIVIAVAIFSCTSTVMAQYVWLNDKGVKQYSDIPPPPSVPSGRILKAPGGIPRTETPIDNAETGTADINTNKKAAPTTADKNADFLKRKAEQAEKDKLAADKARQAADKQKNCETANAYKRALASGQRISRVDASGERVYLSDEERAKEENDNKRALADCK